MKELYRTKLHALLAACILGGCGGGQPDAPEANALEQLAAVQTSISTPSIESGVPGPALTKVSETRISRNVFQYEFRVTFTNGATPLTNGVAAVASVGVGTTVVDGSVQLGNIAAGASVTPTDKVVLRHDRSLAFQPAAITWQVTGDPVTPPVDVGGVDGNGNGVRDDVDARILARYPQALQAAAARQLAKQMQSIVVNAGSVDLQLSSSSRAISCLFDRFGAAAAREAFDSVFKMQFDTPERAKAYMDGQLRFGGKLVHAAPPSRVPGSTCEE